MKLKKLIKNIGVENISIKKLKDIDITGICSDSRLITPGNLFIAKKGNNFDGADFIEEAINFGASCILSDIYNPFLKDVVQIICDDVSSLESIVASSYYENPSKELFSIGITGTNGKTTVGYLLFHILDNCGLLGTIEYIFGSNRVFSSMTTPSNVILQKHLKEMVLSGLKSVALEVTSHGIEQKRIDNIDFDVGIFTNLTEDHLDYHKDMKNYANAKKKIFDILKPSSLAILNKDSPYYDFMKKDIKSEILSYSIENPSDLTAKNINISKKGISFDLYFKDKKEKITSNLLGKFNIYNILCAIAASLRYGVDLEKIKERLKTFSFVKGRLEKIKDRNIYIDYAHTEDALKNVLQSLNDIKERNIITVFGCGGNRDKEKRPFMGKVCCSYSDYSIITSDNPRKEDPLEIIKEIERGFYKKNYEVEVDRYEAIKKAILLAKKDDIVLIAGKGHETYQIFANNTVFFDDKKVVEEIIQKF